MGEGEGGNGMGKTMQLHFNFKINMNNFYSIPMALLLEYHILCSTFLDIWCARVWRST